MSQCFPSWDLEDDAHAPPRHSQRSSPAPLPMLEYRVAELTWENGQLAMHGLGPQRSNVKPASSTLEAIVNQATCKVSFDAMVPCSQSEADQVGPGRRGSCSEADRVPVAPEWEPSFSVSVSGSQRVTVDTYEELGFTSTSLGSADDHESVSVSLHSRLRGGNNNYKRKGASEIDHDEVEKSTKETRCAKFSTSTKRSRAAAIHNQSERKRRDKINQRMKTLQKLVPNSNKTDKASMLDEVIDYLKQLQSQVQMMSRFNMMQQMAIMAPMGMAAMGMGFFDMAARPFIPITPAPAPVDRAMIDPLSAFLASHSHQPMTMDAYTRLQAAMYQQMQQNPSASSSKK